LFKSYAETVTAFISYVIDLIVQLLYTNVKSFLTLDFLQKYRQDFIEVKHL